MKGNMKMVKEEDKCLSPMFPRVHVNDTEKGGPRAPPRNKMALYEQHSIPTQKFSSNTLHPHKSGSVASSVSSIQGGILERTAYSPYVVPHSMPVFSAEKSYSCWTSNEKSITTRGMEFERSSDCVEHMASRASALGTEASVLNVHDLMSGKNPLNEKYDDDNDDFTVPNLAQSEVDAHSRDTHLVAEYRSDSFGAANLQSSTTSDSSIYVLCPRNSIQEMYASENLSRKRERIHAEHESTETLSKQGNKFPNNLKEAREILTVSSNILSAHSNQAAETTMKVLDKTCYQRSILGNESSNKPCEDLQAYESCNSKMLEGSCSGASVGCRLGNYDVKSNGLGELKNAKRSEVLEVSMVESISGLDISPDDVVGVIGPKQFWKARRAIVNQQRAFAIQVFELHRLIKVQKLFAASPKLVSDDCHRIAATIPTNAASLAKTLPIPSRKAAAVQSGSTTLPMPIPMSIPSPNAGNVRNPPWYFQSPSNQWLMPVMSPSEGLIYKPCTGPCPPLPGFMAPCLSSLPPFSNPAYFPSPYSTNAAAARVEEACCPIPSAEGARVIKVVPHNARSATESAARIFRSIQRERRQQQQQLFDL